MKKIFSVSFCLLLILPGTIQAAGLSGISLLGGSSNLLGNYQLKLPTTCSNGQGLSWNVATKAWDTCATSIPSTIIDARSYNGGAKTDATITTALTAMGTTNKVLLLIASGTWTFSQNIDWSAYTNITFKFLPGAIISHGTYTLKIPNIEAALYQIFSGRGLVTPLRTSTIHPEWWGAVPDRTDSTRAFSSAFAAIDAATEWSTGYGTLGTAPKFVTQKGKYVITSTVTMPSCLVWEGVDTQILIDPRVTAFLTPSGFSVLRVNGVQFWGGATAIEYDPVSSDMRMVEIENCVFEQQKAYSLKTTSTSVVNGLDLRIRKCKFLNTSGNTSWVAIQTISDGGIIEDSWFCHHAHYAIENYGILTIRGITNVPMAVGMTLVKNYGVYLNITENRLGSELVGGVVVVENRASGIWNYGSLQYGISIERNFVYQGKNPLIKFYALPNQIIIRDNLGVNFQSGLYFDASIPAADVKNFSSQNYINNNNTTPILAITGDATKYGAFLLEGKSSKTISVAGLINTLSASDAGLTFSATNYSGTAYTDLLGRTWSKLTSKGAGSTGTWTWATGLARCTSGRQYTISVSVDVLDSQVFKLSVAASGQIFETSLGMGYHQINFPFRYDSNNRSVAIYATNYTGTIAVMTVRVLAGDVAPQTQNLVFLGNAVPVAGQPLGWRCTVSGDYSGTPPTWVAEANL